MPSELAKRKYCGRDCSNAAKRRVRKVERVKMACQQCGTDFEVYPGWLKGGRRKYCSAACRTKARPPDHTGHRHTPESRAKMGQRPATRERSSQWKGGRYVSQGYRHVMIALLPPEQIELALAMTTGTYIPEHRVVAAATVGRPLTRADIVHHVNGEKLDNRPENLIVTSNRDHSLEHREITRRFAALMAEVESLRAENQRLRSQHT